MNHDAAAHIRAAVVQAAPVLFDTPRSLQKLADLTADAARQQADLVVFPEAFVGGYPKGHDFGVSVGIRTPEGRDAFRLLFENAIEVPGPATEFLGSVARGHAIHLVVGVVERDGGTLYGSVLMFGSDGSLLGKHRKLMPTAMERVIWGRGDGPTLPVVSTKLGKIGSVICWENYMPLLRTAMYAKGIELYCAVTVDDRDTWVPTVRHIALEGRCFVLSACQLLRKTDLPTDYPTERFSTAQDVLIRGGSCIVGPLGDLLVGPKYGEECILTANLDFDDLVRGKFDLDVVGHYARPDLFRLEVNERAMRSVVFTPAHDHAAPGHESATLRLTLLNVAGRFAVCKLPPDSSVPVWAMAGDVFSVTRTGDELSVVCRQEIVPSGTQAEVGWRCLRVAGAMPFTLVGVLASLTRPVAAAGAGVFAVSTFDTDYLFIKEAEFQTAVAALRGAGHSVEGRSMNEISLGRYRHYKGNEYTVLGTARHSETLEELVVYRQEYGAHGLWVRPKQMFSETVKVDGRDLPRFQHLASSSEEVSESVKNIFDDLPERLPKELVQILVRASDVRIERIISHGHASPPDFWYDQDQSEWVIVLKGAARLQFEDGVVEMKPGDFINIPAFKKHRVDWTTPDEPTVWLGVRYCVVREGGTS